LEELYFRLGFVQKGLPNLRRSSQKATVVRGVWQTASDTRIPPESVGPKHVMFIVWISQYWRGYLNERLHPTSEFSKIRQSTSLKNRKA